jgi:hypothetical protein
MRPDEWNKSDIFTLELISPDNPLDRGPEGLDRVLDVIESLDDELRPDTLHIIKRRMKYSRQTLRKRLPKARVGKATSLHFSRSHRAPDAYIWLTCFEGNEDARCSFELRINPFFFCCETGREEERANRFLKIIRAFASCLPLSYGFAHSNTDFFLGSAPRPENFGVPKQVDAAYWLNVYGPRMVQALGREHLLATPAAHVEELPHGAVLWLSRPTPADFDSHEARLAQARALVHLRPELKLEDTLAVLHQRSLAFTPVPIAFHPDVADILLRQVELGGLMQKRQLVERFNAYRPPEVSEWLPASQAPEPDVPDLQAAIETYENLYAEQLVALLYKQLPAKDQFRSPEALPHIDFHLWRMAWGRVMDTQGKEALIPALGAYLGFLLVHVLGGKWLPRLNLAESAVLVGDRAWRPFLRARHCLEGEQAPLDFSLTQFFRAAQRRQEGAVRNA